MHAMVQTMTSDVDAGASVAKMAAVLTAAVSIKTAAAVKCALKIINVVYNPSAKTMRNVVQAFAARRGCVRIIAEAQPIAPQAFCVMTIKRANSIWPASTIPTAWI